MRLIVLMAIIEFQYSCLDNRKQCMQINNEINNEIVSGAPQGFIVGPALFNLFASVHNFADNNSLSNIAATVDRLMQKLESECRVAIK